MLSFDDIAKLFSYDLQSKSCIEIEFTVVGYPNYQSCWMGKMPDKSDSEKDVYWYGLASDGSEAYEYDNYSDFSNALVFSGKSINEVWNHIEILSIDGCDPEERIRFYI